MGTKTYTTNDVLARLRMETSGNKLRQFARETGIDAGFVSRVLSGKAVLSRNLAGALGFDKKPSVYVRRQTEK